MSATLFSDCIIALQDFVAAASNNSEYRRRCKVALSEFQSVTRMRLWFRYATEGDKVRAIINLQTGNIEKILQKTRGFPAGCVIAYVDGDDLLMGSSYCCRKDRPRYSRDVGRWQALLSSVPVAPWTCTAPFVNSLLVAESFPTPACRLTIADFHHWLCRHKPMITDMATISDAQLKQVIALPSASDLVELSSLYRQYGTLLAVPAQPAEAAAAA